MCIQGSLLNSALTYLSTDDLYNTRLVSKEFKKISDAQTSWNAAIGSYNLMPNGGQSSPFFNFKAAVRHSGWDQTLSVYQNENPRMAISEIFFRVRHSPPVHESISYLSVGLAFHISPQTPPMASHTLEHSSSEGTLSPKSYAAKQLQSQLRFQTLFSKIVTGIQANLFLNVYSVMPYVKLMLSDFGHSPQLFQWAILFLRKMIYSHTADSLVTFDSCALSATKRQLLLTITHLFSDVVGTEASVAACAMDLSRFLYSVALSPSQEGYNAIGSIWYHSLSIGDIICHNHLVNYCAQLNLERMADIAIPDHYFALLSNEPEFVEAILVNSDLSLPFCGEAMPLHVALTCRASLSARALIDFYKRALAACLSEDRKITFTFREHSTTKLVEECFNRTRVTRTHIIQTHLDLLDQNGTTPLILAIQTNQPSITRQLLDLGVSPNRADKEGKTPFQHAIAAHSATFLEYLIRHPEFLRQNIGTTPQIQTICRSKSLAKYQMLELYLTCFPDAINDSDAQGNVAIHLAVEANDPNALLLLIRNGANVSVENQDSSSPLHAAASLNYLTMIDALHAAGAKLESGREQGLTPLLSACWQANEEAALKLLELGADPTARLQQPEDPFHNMQPLQIAIHHRLMRLIEKLIQHRAVQDDEGDEMTSPILIAVRSNDQELIRLIRPWIKIDARVGLITPMEAASAAGNLPLIKLLSELGADFEVGCPLGCAIANLHVEVVRYLLQIGCDSKALFNEMTLFETLQTTFSPDKIVEFWRIAEFLECEEEAREFIASRTDITQDEICDALGIAKLYKRRRGD